MQFSEESEWLYLDLPVARNVQPAIDGTTALIAGRSNVQSPLFPDY